MKLRIASISVLTICGLMLAVAPAMASTILYSNGPYNGTINAWNLGYGYAVSDSFTVASGSSIESLSLVYWDFDMTDILTTIDMAIGSTAFGGSFQTIAATNTFLTINIYGEALYQADFTFANIPWSGAGWITLQNACTTFGCSDGITAVYWDENDGPSLAFENVEGAIGSETFSLDGPSSTTPEPGTLMLLGSGVLGLAGVIRRKLTL